mmetsp:Transcript_36524/g.53579  ORF Transcript_36524/g.53579 Transcript_36524/m.53579 type:complete len:92 (-) Transcript_36524:1247-1522(-)
MKPNSRDANMAPSKATAMMDVAIDINTEGAVCFAISCTSTSAEKRLEPSINSAKETLATAMAVNDARVRVDFNVARIESPSSLSTKAGNLV